MSSFARVLPAALLTLAAAFAPGCTHFANVEEVASPDGIPTFVSSRQWRDGTPRAVITERVVGTAGPCETLEIERRFYDPTGMPTQRIVDVQRCDVVERRTSIDYDLAGSTEVRITQRDHDRDGTFELEQTESVALTQGSLAALRESAQ